MKHLKLFEEYRFIKIDPSKSNVKDTEESFWIESKYDYKKQKGMFGNDYKKNYEKIKVNLETIDNLLKKASKQVSNEVDPYGEEDWDDISENLVFVFRQIRKLASYNEKGYDVQEYLTFENFLNTEDLHKLRELGFGIYIYNDSGEYSDYFGDKYRISWRW